MSFNQAAPDFDRMKRDLEDAIYNAFHQNRKHSPQDVAYRFSGGFGVQKAMNRLYRRINRDNGEARAAWETVRSPFGGSLRPFDANEAHQIITGGLEQRLKNMSEPSVMSPLPLAVQAPAPDRKPEQGCLF